MELKEVALAALKPFKGNPRVHPDQAIEKLVRSIQEFGWTNPILAAQDGTILAGHARLKAAVKAGITTVPVIYLDIPQEKIPLYVIADNRLQDETDWALPALGDLLSELKLGPLDIELTGFDFKEINELLAQLNGGKEEDFDVEEALRVAPELATDIKPGDIYQLGEHRLMCGDSTKREGVERLMGSEKVDMVFADPPYGINLNTNFKSKFNWKKKHPEVPGFKLPLLSGNYSPIIGDDKEFDYRQFTWLNCKEQFWCGGDNYCWSLPRGGGWFVWDKLVGRKSFSGMGGFELIWSKQSHFREIISINWLGVYGFGGEDTKSRVHPTQKPTALTGWFVERFSKPGHLILDPFGGSGSTLIACEKLGRRCRMMEIDPHYCQVIIARWEAFTGGQVIKVAGGNKNDG